MAHKDDFLIELAFGDRTGSEAEEALRSMKAESLKELDAYRDMREGLKQLRDIPEMQLSGDRLRDAILREGLKPAPAVNPLRWLWAAVPVAGAMAVAFIVMNPTSNSATPVSRSVVNPGDSIVAQVVEPDSSVTNYDLKAWADFKGFSAIEESAPQAKAVTNAAPERRRKPARVRRDTGSTLVAARTADTALSAPISFDGNPTMAMGNDPTNSGLNARSAPDVVEIVNDPLRPSGTRAVEVQSASESVIGG